MVTIEGIGALCYHMFTIAEVLSTLMKAVLLLVLLVSAPVEEHGSTIISQQVLGTLQVYDAVV